MFNAPFVSLSLYFVVSIFLFSFFFLGKIEIAFQFSSICIFLLHPFVFLALFSGLRACSICKCNGSEIEIQPDCGSPYLSLPLWLYISPAL